jgi:hypothetical protein
MAAINNDFSLLALGFGYESVRFVLDFYVELSLRLSNSKESCWSKALIYVSFSVISCDSMRSWSTNFDYDSINNLCYLNFA